MEVTMRFVCVLLSMFFYVTSHVYGEELTPGDKGYMHEELHKHYQTIFSGGRCHCKTGECRPTVFRYKGGDVNRVQMKHQGVWIDIPPSALIEKETVPKELWGYQAHICAFETPSGINVECAILTKGTS
jgi:hypothetical protein